MSKSEPQKKLSRAKFGCPPNLDIAVKLANIFRSVSQKFESFESFAEYYFPYFLELQKIDSILSQHLSQHSNPNEFLNQFLNLSEIGKELAETIGVACLVFRPGNGEKFVLDDQTINQCAEKYRVFLQNSDSLFMLANAFNNLRLGIGENIKLPHFQTINLLYISKEKQGKKVKSIPNLFSLNAVIDIDPDRLRVCDICKNIFWAKRIDSETCSPQCANNLRVKNYRKLTPEQKAEIKARRELNRKNIKDGKVKQIKRKA